MKNSENNFQKYILELEISFIKKNKKYIRWFSIMYNIGKYIFFRDIHIEPDKLRYIDYKKKSYSLTSK